jgi:hypothetical protein
MADFRRDIGRDFGDDPPKADASGYLADFAAMFCEAAPALVFLATADGAVTAVDDLETGIPLSLAGHLAREALSGSEECGLHTWMTAVGSVQYRAFGLRLGNRLEDRILGGLLTNWKICCALGVPLGGAERAFHWQVHFSNSNPYTKEGINQVSVSLTARTSIESVKPIQSPLLEEAPQEKRRDGQNSPGATGGAT